MPLRILRLRLPSRTALGLLLVLAIRQPVGASAPAQALEPSAWRATVTPLAARALAPRPSLPSSTACLEAYYESIRLWGEVVAAQIRPVPGHPDGNYLGLPGHAENDVRPTAYAAMVLAFLAEFQPPRARLEAERRQAMRAAAVGLLRYLTASHVTGGGACVNGKPWGRQWQSAMWARAVGMAGWMLWPHLDEPLQTAVAKLVAFEADRFVGTAPKSSSRNDTGAEENAWNASVTALACNMMPAHPRSKNWEESAKRYMYNTFSVAADAQDATPGDDGRPIREWVTTVNAHDDFTVENHGLVHVGYLKTAAAELQENAIHWLLAGREVPRACSHHMADVFQVLLACMAWDGAPVYFAGNDWKTYHSQVSDLVVYTMRSLLAADGQAAYLEAVAWDWVKRIQRAERGYYNVRRDPEYGGLCATRLIACCLAQGLVDRAVPPVCEAEFERAASGVRHLASASTVLHRTPNKFASFTWAQKRMALALPRQGTWVLWPHFDSYLGQINGEGTAERQAPLENLRVQMRPDGFQVSGTLVRCRGKLSHDFCYASPAGEYTVYIERLRPQSGFRLASRETGIIGLEYPLGKNSRTLFGPFGKVETTGYGGEATIRQLVGDWLNIDNSVGYVVRRIGQRENVMRYHDEASGSGRVPQLQEWISLVGEAPPALGRKGSWACVVTFLNQRAVDTAAWSSRLQFSVEGDRATCRIGDEVVTVEF